VCWPRALALAALPLLPPALGGELRGVGLPAVLVSASGGVLGLVLLWRRRHGLARIAAACAPVRAARRVGAGPLPVGAAGQMLLAESAAPPVIAGPVLIVLLTGLAIVAPSYVFHAPHPARPPRLTPRWRGPVPVVTELHRRQVFGAENLPGVQFGNTGPAPRGPRGRGRARGRPVSS